MVLKRDPQKMHKTIFEELRDSDLPRQEKTIERLMDEGLILVGAGGETTAQALTVLTFHLLNNRENFLELRAELDRIMPDPESSVSWQTLEQLPLLVRHIIMWSENWLMEIREPLLQKPTA